jgi:hypothetical protein
MEDSIILVDRDEISDLSGNDISDEVWLEIKVRIARDKHLWQVIDETISDIVIELTEEE